MNIGNRELILLTDYRGAFWSTIRNRWGLCSLDVEELRRAFEVNGYWLRVLPFADIDLRTQEFRGRAILYQCSEDSGGRYKDFIEDVLLGIQLQGGRLIPPFHCFRAHHNKVFMEILRDLSGDADLLTPRAKAYGTFEDFSGSGGGPFAYPAVLKSAWGAGGGGVRLARNFGEATRFAANFSRSAGVLESVKEWLKRRWRRRIGYVPFSLNRCKFVVQEFVPGLSGDFKVLVYWDRYYVVSRANRRGDFRASGSGILSWPESPPDSLLDFAQRAFRQFHVPMMSLDIAMGDNGPVLIEFQFVCFGPAALELSKWYFRQHEGRWVRVQAESVPETEFARSVCCYMEDQLQ